MQRHDHLRTGVRGRGRRSACGRRVSDAVAALGNLAFSQAELDEIDKRAMDAGVNIWKRSSTA